MLITILELTELKRIFKIIMIESKQHINEIAQIRGKKIREKLVFSILS